MKYLRTGLAVSAFMALSTVASAGITSSGFYNDDAAFSLNSGATSLTGALPNLRGQGRSVTLGGATITADNTIFVGSGWSSWMPGGNAIAVSGVETIGISVKKPKRFLKWQASKDYAFCITQLDKIADIKRNNPEAFVDTVNQIIGELFNHLNHLIAKRVRKAVDKHQGPSLKDFSTEELTRKLEIPSQLTALFLGDGKRQVQHEQY